MKYGKTVDWCHGEGEIGWVEKLLILSHCSWENEIEKENGSHERTWAHSIFARYLQCKSGWNNRFNKPRIFNAIQCNRKSIVIQPK